MGFIFLCAKYFSFRSFEFGVTNFLTIFKCEIQSKPENTLIVNYQKGKKKASSSIILYFYDDNHLLLYHPFNRLNGRQWL